MNKPSWFAARRLQSQLMIWAALILIVTVPITQEVRTRRNIRLLEQNLRDRNTQLVVAVSRTLELASKPPQPLSVNAVERRLREFVEADRTLTRLDIIQRQGDLGENPTVLASSSPMPDSPTGPLSRGLVTEIRLIGTERMMVTTLEVGGTDYSLIAFSTLKNIDNYELSNRSQTPVFAAILILITITLMHLMFRFTLSRRFDELLQGIQHAREGAVSHIPDDRQDEIGIIAKTLNGLLSQVQSFNIDLQHKVSEATEALNKRNSDLEEATRQMLEMEQQLLDSRRMATVGQMAATFAHEIGSPMSSLSAHVQLLLEDKQLSKEQRETLGLIRQQIQSMVQIVHEMLRSARRSPSDFVLTDINGIIRTVVQLVHAKLMAQKIEVVMDLDSVPPVRGYALYLQEAFLNIINNAYDAMPEGGRLEVKSWFDMKEQFVNIRISDTGPGINPELVDQMFKRFVTTKGMGEGTGLGLGIVKEIVDSHRGTISISPNNGRGSAAHIMFPVETAAVVAS